MEIEPQKSRALFSYLFPYTIILLIPLILFTYLINTSMRKNRGNLVLPRFCIIHDNMGGIAI